MVGDKTSTAQSLIWDPGSLRIDYSVAATTPAVEFEGRAGNRHLEIRNNTSYLTYETGEDAPTGKVASTTTIVVNEATDQGAETTGSAFMGANGDSGPTILANFKGIDTIEVSGAAGLYFENHGGQGMAVSGTPHDDTLAGGSGQDRLSTGDGADTMAGGGGDDTLVAGAGNDLIFGDQGDDNLTGGAGNDVFHFQFDGGHDRITDFERGDQLNFANMRADEVTVTDLGFATLFSWQGGTAFVAVTGLAAGDDYVFHSLN